MTASASANAHEWSTESLFNKSQVYASRMSSLASKPEYALWSVFTLELLARAALSKVTPTLLAEPDDWKNTYFAATGNKVDKTIPKSISTKKVIIILNSIYAEVFTQEIKGFCLSHLDRRNEELHSGGLPFHGLGSAEWLPRFYVAVEALLKILEKNLGDFFDKDIQANASKLIAAYQDENAKAVLGIIAKFKKKWEQIPAEEQDKLKNQALLTMTKQYGHVSPCPACTSSALLHGEPMGSPDIETDDIITVKQPMLPSAFECIACGLKITGYSKLQACGLGDQYLSTTHYEPAEYFGIETMEEDWSGFMEDNNE